MLWEDRSAASIAGQQGAVSVASSRQLDEDEEGILQTGLTLGCWTAG